MLIDKLRARLEARIEQELQDCADLLPGCLEAAAASSAQQCSKLLLARLMRVSHMLRFLPMEDSAAWPRPRRLTLLQLMRQLADMAAGGRDKLDAGDDDEGSANTLAALFHGELWPMVCLARAKLLSRIRGEAGMLVTNLGGGRQGSLVARLRQGLTALTLPLDYVSPAAAAWLQACMPDTGSGREAQDSGLTLAILCLWLEAQAGTRVMSAQPPLRVLHDMQLEAARRRLEDCLSQQLRVLRQIPHWHSSVATRQAVGQCLRHLQVCGDFLGRQDLVLVCLELECQLHEEEGGQLQQTIVALVLAAEGLVADSAIPGLPVTLSVRALEPDMFILWRESLVDWGSLLQEHVDNQQQGASKIHASQDLLRAVYHMALASAWLSLPQVARLANHCFQYLSQFWRQQAPLGPEMLSILRAMPPLLHALTASSPAPTLPWLRLESRLHQDLSLQANTVTTLAADSGEPSLPRLLASHFTLLAHPSSLDFSRMGREPQLHRQVLEELGLLERGAAALMVYRLEALTGALRECHAELLARPGVTWPEKLLYQAHWQLAAMLDQAAAWQEVTDAQSLAESLYDYLRAQSAAAGDWVREDAASGEVMPVWESELRRGVRQLCGVIGRHVHLALAPTAAGIEPCASLRACLDELLRYVLVEAAESVHERRQAGKSSVPSLSLTLAADADAFTLESDEWSRPLPQHRLQRSRLRKLGAELEVMVMTGRHTRYQVRLSAAQGRSETD